MVRTAKPGIKPHGLYDCYMQPKWPQDFRHSCSYSCISLYNMKQRDPYAWDGSQVLGEFVRLDESNLLWQNEFMFVYPVFACLSFVLYVLCVCVFLCALVLVHSFVILYIKRFFFCFSSGGFLCLTGRFMNVIDILYMHVNRHINFVGPFMFCPVHGWESNTMYNNQESVPVVTIEIHR